MSVKLKIRCNHCQQSLRVSQEKLGTQIRCPNCHQKCIAESKHNALIIETMEAGLQTASERFSGVAESSEDFSPEVADKVAIHPLQKIGRFEIRQLLGEGGFGKVYQAFDPQLGRTVALKVPTFGANNQRRMRRFVTEARSAARLHHPNIAAVFENGRAETGELYIASEFVDGATLKERLEKSDPPLREKVKWIRDLAGALAYAHSEGIIHRDIKPENILIDSIHGRPMIVDFGLAKVLDESSEDAEGHLKTTDGILGTPAFMSPEQARGELKNVGPHSDQYSLGAVMYQCLTGQPPFAGAVYMIIAAVSSDEGPSPVRSVGSWIPQDLAAVCEKAMSKRDAFRYGSCLDFAADLDGWLSGNGVSARRASLLMRNMRLVYRYPWQSSLVGAVILFLTTIAAVASIAFQRSESDLLRINEERIRALAAENANGKLVTELTRKNSEIEVEKQRAIAAQKQAELVADRLAAQIAETERQRQNATESTKVAQTATEAASQATSDAEISSYVASILQARTRLDNGAPEEARRVLAATNPKFRGFEHVFLSAKASPVLFEEVIPEVGVSGKNGITSIAVDENMGSICLLNRAYGSVQWGIREPDSNSKFTWIQKSAPFLSTPQTTVDNTNVEELTISMAPGGRSFAAVCCQPTFPAVGNSAKTMVRVIGLPDDAVAAKSLTDTGWHNVDSKTTDHDSLRFTAIGINDLRVSSRDGSYNHWERCGPHSRSPSYTLQIDDSEHRIKVETQAGRVPRRYIGHSSKKKATVTLLTSDSKRVFIGYGDGSSELTDVSGGHTVQFLPTSNNRGSAVGALFPPGDEYIFVISTSVVIQKHKINTGELVQVFNPFDSGRTFATNLVPSGRAIALVRSEQVATAEGQPPVYALSAAAIDIDDLSIRKRLHSDNTDDKVPFYATFMDSGSHLIVAYGKRVAVHDLSTGVVTAEHVLEMGRPFSVAQTPNAKGVIRIFCSYRGNEWYDWDFGKNEVTAGGKPSPVGLTLAEIEDYWKADRTRNAPSWIRNDANVGRMLCFATSKDGSRIFSGHEDGNVAIWDIGTQTQLLVFSSGKAAVQSIEVRNDALALVCTSADGDLSIFGDHRQAKLFDSDSSVTPP